MVQISEKSFLKKCLNGNFQSTFNYLFAFQIRLTGRKGRSGDLALDDIFILQDSCDDPVITAPPPTEMRKFHRIKYF